MKHVLAALFGFHLLLGNVCLMNVAFAADAPMHDGHAGHVQMHGQCSELACTGGEADEDDSLPQDCATGHCFMTDLSDFSVLAPGGQEVQDAPAFLPFLITQALLVTGPSVPSPEFDIRKPSLSVTTVVMRR